MLLSTIGAIALFALTIIAGVLTNMISTDIEKRAYGWASYIIMLAVKKLPPKFRERFEEEWMADLADQPSPLSQLIFAAGSLVAAREISFAEYRQAVPCSFGARERLKKRLLDLGITIPVVVALAPVFILVAIAIKLDSPGPVVFRQNRLGRGARLFGLFKFRSMYVNAGGEKRISRVGRFIRATSLDELPALLNVLSGDMSLVGPRPNQFSLGSCDQVYRMIDEGDVQRQLVKPGFAGLAQVRDVRAAKLAELDRTAPLDIENEYIRGWGIWRDIKLLAAAFAAVMFTKPDEQEDAADDH